MTPSRPRVWDIGAALLVGAGGLGFVALGLTRHPAQTAASYLAAYVAVLDLVLGAAILLMIEHLIGASWFVVLRRPMEATLAALPALALLFIPIALAASSLYPWADLTRFGPAAREIVARKTLYLNLPFFRLRALVYFVCWIGMAELLRRWSIRQDRTPGDRWNRLQRRLAAPGLIVFGFTLTFAAFDWVMSLAPTWYSSIFGLQLFSGAMVGATAWLAVLAPGVNDEAGQASVTPDHYSGVGKLLLTFVIFWAYLSFAQLLIIWIADVPEEVTWYLPRLHGSWLWLAVFVLAGHFFLPFFILLSYRAKRRAHVLRRLGLWLIAMHYLETYWIVLPQLRPDTAAPHWMDVVSLAAIAGLAWAFGRWRVRAIPRLPVGDPDLPASLEYVET